jgi:riboflavin biosynthesis pyrimidine reductase
MPKPDYTALDLPPAPPGRPCVLVNMVMSADGKVVLEETEQGLGSKVDQRLMRELRVHADVVLNGAGTLRKSGSSPRLGGFRELELLRELRGKSRFPVAAIISGSGDLPLDRVFFTAKEFEAVVYLGEEAPPDRRAAIEATGRSVVVLPAAGRIATMLAHMRHELGAQVLLLEGGPTLNAEFFAIGAVDELFLTIGPIVAGGATRPSAVGGEPFGRARAPRLDLAWAVPNEETGEVYLRYRVRREAIDA